MRSQPEVLLVDHPLPWLRYVDAARVTAPGLTLNGMKVRNDAMEKLGKVAGFIVDGTTTRPYYVVVDSGGWFKSKDFLVPIGHAHIDDDRDALVVNLSKERIERFPGFASDEFERLTESDVRKMNDAICEACAETPVMYTPSDPLSAAWSRPEFTQPDWWAAVSPPFSAASELMPEGNAVLNDNYPPSKVARATGELQAGQIAREERQTVRKDKVHESERDREMVVARETDVSPHFDGRAQPGDVLGLETGGEQTHVGETGKDEDKRREDAQRAAAKHKP